MHPANPKNPPPDYSEFTAAQIGAVLGQTRQAIRERLSRIGPTDSRRVSGNDAWTWNEAVLPPAMLSELYAVAREKGFESPGAMFRAGVTTWKPTRTVKGK